MMRRILHATDFSRASRPAFRQAVSMARADRAELILVHVLEPMLPVVEGGYIPAGEYERLEGAARRAAQRRLDTWLKTARQAGVRCRGLLSEGAAHDGILRAARSTRAQLIVIGTHGRTGLARLFLGSVAGRVVAQSPVPVLTVRDSVAVPAVRPRRRAKDAG